MPDAKDRPRGEPLPFEGTSAESSPELPRRLDICPRRIPLKSVAIDVHNPSGLHARPAATFVKAAAAYPCSIQVENLSKATTPVNAKSILAVLGQGVSKGNTIRLTADGPREDEAIEGLSELIRAGLGESIEG